MISINGQVNTLMLAAQIKSRFRLTVKAHSLPFQVARRGPVAGSALLGPARLAPGPADSCGRPGSAQLRAASSLTFGAASCAPTSRQDPSTLGTVSGQAGSASLRQASAHRARQIRQPNRLPAPRPLRAIHSAPASSAPARTSASTSTSTSTSANCNFKANPLAGATPTLARGHFCGRGRRRPCSSGSTGGCSRRRRQARKAPETKAADVDEDEWLGRVLLLAITITIIIIIITTIIAIIIMMIMTRAGRLCFGRPLAAGELHDPSNKWPLGCGDLLAPAALHFVPFAPSA